MARSGSALILFAAALLAAPARSARGDEPQPVTVTVDVLSEAIEEYVAYVAIARDGTVLSEATEVASACELRAIDPALSPATIFETFPRLRPHLGDFEGALEASALPWHHRYDVFGPVHVTVTGRTVHYSVRERPRAYASPIAWIGDAALRARLRVDIEPAGAAGFTLTGHIAGRTATIDRASGSLSLDGLRRLVALHDVALEYRRLAAEAGRDPVRKRFASAAAARAVYDEAVRDDAFRAGRWVLRIDGVALETGHPAALAAYDAYVSGGAALVRPLRSP